MCNDIVVRLKAFMNHVGLPSTQFADCAKIARPTISQLLNGRNRKVSNELISKLHDAFPELNILWLMFGDGDMINKTEINPVTPPSQTLFRQFPERQSSEDDQYGLDSQKTSAKRDNMVSASREANEKFNASDLGSATSVQIPVTPNSEMSKRIKSIMVFYTDSSFEIFTPSNM